MSSRIGNMSCGMSMLGSVRMVRNDMRSTIGGCEGRLRASHGSESGSELRPLARKLVEAGLPSGFVQHEDEL